MRVVGSVVEAESGRPLEGLLVRAYDKDLIFDDRLGMTVFERFTKRAFDLLIALSLVSVWIWQDARAHDTSPWPYLIITALTGSIGPLLYLLRRPADSAPRLTARGYERHAIARGTSLRGRRFF